MPQTPDIANSNEDQIMLGTTGKIGSLMSKELESITHAPQAASSSSSSSTQKKFQEPPVSVPCGYSPRKTQPRKIYENTKKPETRKKEHVIEVNTCREKIEKKEKKKRTHIVEVVDIKCNNPMSSRIKKLGFSRLSESKIV